MAACAAPRSRRRARPMTQSVANYRQTVLAGIPAGRGPARGLRILEQQADAQHLRARIGPRARSQLTLNQYQAGTVAYTNVVVAQTTALAAEQTALTIEQSRLVAASTLIEALGGGWDRTQLPALDSARK